MVVNHELQSRKNGRVEILADGTRLNRITIN
jgi:hypothetical protein